MPWRTDELQKLLGAAQEEEVATVVQTTTSKPDWIVLGDKESSEPNVVIIIMKDANYDGFENPEFLCTPRTKEEKKKRTPPY